MNSAVRSLLKFADKQIIKEDFRKLGINLMTASAVGAFITHLNDMTLVGLIIIGWLGLVGMFLWLLGICKGR